MISIVVLTLLAACADGAENLRGTSESSATSLSMAEIEAAAEADMQAEAQAEAAAEAQMEEQLHQEALAEVAAQQAAEHAAAAEKADMEAEAGEGQGMQTMSLMQALSMATAEAEKKTEAESEHLSSADSMLEMNAVSDSQAHTEDQLQALQLQEAQALQQTGARVDMREVQHNQLKRMLLQLEEGASKQVAAQESSAGSYDRSLTAATDAMLMSLMAHIAIHTQKDAKKPNMSQQEFETEARKHTKEWLTQNPAMAASATVFKAKMAFNPLFVEKCHKLDWEYEWAKTLEDEKKRAQCVMLKMLEDDPHTTTV